MTLTDLEFKAEDFERLETLEYWWKEIADEVNRLLRERLEKAPKVWGKEDRDFGLMVYFDDEDGPDEPTHTASLICVEEIK